MKIASWCYDRPTLSSLLYYDDHCYTMSIQPETRHAVGDSTFAMTVDVDMDDASGAVQRQFAPITTSCSAVPVSTIITTTTSGGLSPTKNSKDSIQELKKSLTLDFGSPESVKKSLTTPEVLSFLRFTSPDLEKFFSQQYNTPGGLVTNTPTPTSFFYPKNVTNEQEQYARGFIDALNQLHLLRGPCIPMTSLLSPGFVTTTIQQADKDELNKFRESKYFGLFESLSAVSIEQLFRTLTANAVWTPGTSFPSSTSINSSTVAGSSATPTTISLPVQPSVIFPNLPNQLSVITSGGGGLHNANNAFNAAVAAASAVFKQEPPQQTNSHSPSPCVSPNSASCSSVHSDQAYTPPPTQVSVHSSSMNYTPLAPVTFGNLVVPSSMLPTAAQFITLSTNGSNSSNNHSPRTLSSKHVQHQQTNSLSHQQHLGVNVKLEVAQQQVQHQNDFSINNSQNGNSSSNSNIPAGMSVSPMDPRSQERMKLERKRARNRVAATKCRRRKIEKITNLDDKVKELVKQNDEIEDKINICKQDVARLRQLVKEHQLRGCNLQVI